LFDLLYMCIVPNDNVFLQVSNGFIRLTKASELDVLLEPEVKFQRALRKLSVKSSREGHKRWCTFDFRSAALFSLHHARASVQL